MFKQNFNKPGPGIEKDAPQKKGFALFMDIFIREFWTIIGLNFIFMFSCLPIITIGPSICAMNYIFAKMMRDEPIDVFPDYKRGFFINLKQGILIGIIVTIIVYILITAYSFYGLVLGYVAYVFIGLLGIFAAICMYMFPLAATISLPIKAVLKNSALLVLISPKQTLGALFYNTLIIVASLYYYPTCIYYFLIIGFSVLMFINIFFAYPQIEKHATVSDTTETESEFEE